MKFVVAVVMLALAVGVNSSLLPLTAQIAPAVSYVTSSLGGGPLLAQGAWGGPTAWGGSAAITGLGGLGLGLHGGIPGISLSQGPVGAAIAAPIAAPLALGHGAGVYVAKTRGAIHTAPLAGHINSATSLNLAPAPGTH
ncbi:adult cuticle protein 1-like [Bactrocera neohumeralis]|uniref:Adult cuticle protein 1 n=1 Tax=Bactrocera dorsalis TaxID=27457 RepID=A0A6I9VK63_BACDO|nr:adult cuticle protein 1 [Bactrocera dorsalis]XP_039952702.1 adult cuticle protein 1-like [Bactrocera tryoni]XP_050320360.1 adult cuticle protein 1-like [Bactrocera neohumeralis]